MREIFTLNPIKNKPKGLFTQLNSTIKHFPSSEIKDIAVLKGN